MEGEVHPLSARSAPQACRRHKGHSVLFVGSGHMEFTSLREILQIDTCMRNQSDGASGN